MAVKAFEQPKGSGELWLSITHQGFRCKWKVGKNKQMIFGMAASGQKALEAGKDFFGVMDATVMYHFLPAHDQRLQTFRLIPGGRTD